MESDKKPIGTRYKEISKEILVRVECPSIFENASFFLFLLITAWLGYAVFLSFSSKQALYS